MFLTTIISPLFRIDRYEDGIFPGHSTTTLTKAAREHLTLRYSLNTPVSDVHGPPTKVEPHKLEDVKKLLLPQSKHYTISNLTMTPINVVSADIIAQNKKSAQFPLVRELRRICCFHPDMLLDDFLYIAVTIDKATIQYLFEKGQLTDIRISPLTCEADLGNIPHYT